MLLLDGHSLAYRAFYALPVENFSTTSGQPTNAVYGFTSMLINVLRDERPTHVAVAFDVSRTTFRTAEFPEYKATRSASPAEFAGQVDWVRTVLAAMRVPALSVEGYEADDIIATLATQAEARGFTVDIVTGDRDAFQLVDARTTVLYPKRGVSDIARMDPAAVEERFGLPPSQYADYAALRGDKSDNLPNIPGVGEKTAAKWVREYGGLDGLVDNADQVPGRAGESLRAHLAQVLLNRRLTELVRDVPLDLTVDELEWSGFDRSDVHEVFDDLEFQVLRERLFDVFADEAESAGARAIEVRLSDASPLEWLADRGFVPGQAANGDAVAAVALTVVGRWGRGTGEVDALVLAAADADPIWIDADAVDDAVQGWLADPGAPKVMHDAKGPLLALYAAGWGFGGLVMDTALAAYLLLPGQRSFDLRDLCARFAHIDLDRGEDDGGQLTIGDLDGGERQLSAAAETAAMLTLAEVLEGQLAERDALPLLRDVELPTLILLAQMERAGIAVDAPYLASLEQQYGGEVRKAEEAAWEIAGRTFNLGSPKQLQELLFGERGLPKTKKIKTGYTTDAEALATLYQQTQDPLLETILRFRDVSKLRQTVAGLLPLVDDHSRIHTTFNQMVAATGRLSSTDPNLQNIPIRTEEGRQIRAGFVVGEGYQTLLTADYSQIEMRIMAHLSGDDGLIEAFRSGEDLHTTVGSRVFGVPADEVDPEMRRRVKAMSYGLAYGLSAFGLSQQLQISRAEAQGLMDEYFLRFGGVRDYLAEAVEQARHTGWTETLMGRRRYLPDLNSDNRQRRAMAERMALNAPIQGSAADLVKVAMLNVRVALARQQLHSRLLLQVHDELVLEVAPGEVDAVTELVRREMAGAYELLVPLEVSVGTGRTWAEAGH
ncbi:MAG: DNA polymerase I [Actinobacteria bacterium]|nr:MAG: DNA polymerase I [Actinomycetota bacterium]